MASSHGLLDLIPLASPTLLLFANLCFLHISRLYCAILVIHNAWYGIIVLSSGAF